MNYIDLSIISEIVTSLLPQFQFPSLTTVLLFAVLRYHGHLTLLTKMRFLFLPRVIGAWVGGLLVFFTNCHFLSLWFVGSWWLIEKALISEADGYSLTRFQKAMQPIRPM